MLNTNRDLAETMRRAAECLALCLVILFVSPLWAQTGRGTVIGSIMDSSGANIPAAKVQITQIATNSVFELQTNEEGLYAAPNLPVGTYKVTASKTGFATLPPCPYKSQAR